MPDFIKRNQWVWNLLSAAIVAGITWGAMTTNQKMMAKEISDLRESFHIHETSQTADEKAEEKEHSDVKAILARLEERLAAVQDQLKQLARSQNRNP